jgi:sugar lactone lactonase YvrE
MHKTFCLLLAAAGFALTCSAVETKTWEQNGYADFEKTGLKKVSLRSDGRLTLAPAFVEVLDSSSPYLWSLVEDSKGNLYAGGGGPGGPGARVYMRSKDGTTKTLAELDGLEVHAVAVDGKDQVYAATSPDGKIYRISASGKSQVFYDPKAKYIWGMAFNSKGDLFVATGDEGTVYRVTPDGNGSVFFQTDQTHARSLTLDPKENLIVGTEPDGLIIRISPSGQGFVLYQAPKSEITAVAVGKDGSIYAAGVGQKKPAAPVPTAPPARLPVTPTPQPTATIAASAVQSGQRPPAQPPSIIPTVPLLLGGSEVYRIHPDGFSQKVWSDSKDVAYTIGFDSEGRPLVGTGNRGVIYRLDSDLLFTALVTAPPTQVTSIFSGSQGKIYAATGNIGKVYQIGPGLEKEGSVEAEAFDADLFSLWGRLSFRAAPNGGSIRFDTRSGNLDRPGKDWSAWQAVTIQEGGGRVQSPKARFLQWKLTMASSPEGRSPEVYSIDVAYLQQNVAPVIEEIEITPPNYRFPVQTLTVTPSQTITLQPLTGRKRSSKPPTIASSTAVAMQYAKGDIGARWAATDENGDTLRYKAEIRGVKETEWKLLKEDLDYKHLSWDSTAFPDGSYVLRVIASDAPDNPPAQALTARLVSDPFLIDNTPPVISGLSASVTGGKLDVRWRAKDTYSVIQKAEYSVNGGDWERVEPTTKVSDSPELTYSLVLEKGSGERTIAVRVTDEYDNQSVESVVVR